MKKEIFNSLVRIRAQGYEFNWAEPFKPVNEESGIGTGFFINKDGYILTCAHVVSSAVSISVSIPSNGKDDFEAIIVSFFPEKDMAILKIKNCNMKLNYLKLGNSDKIDAGEDVNAIGYPLGQEKLKITKGIISGREEGLIQTDTPLNPGNSGGPLLNKKDEVIGINSAAFKSEDAENVGFAIPINLFLNIKSEMLINSEMKLLFQPIIGCVFQNTNKDIISYYNCIKNCVDGIVIQKILPGSDMDSKEVKEGDILCKFDNFDIDNHGECSVNWDIEKVPLSSIVNRYNVGDNVKIKLWSVGNKKIINKEIGIKSTNDIFKVREKYPLFEKIDWEIFGGFVVMNLCLNHVNIENSLLIDFLKPENRIKERLVISHIYPGSTLSKSEIINTGDVITEVNNMKVKNVNDFRKIVKKPIRNNGIDYITLRTKDDKLMIVELNNILKDNIFLSQQYQFPITKLNESILKSMNKKNKKKKSKSKNKSNSKTKKLLKK